MQAEDIQRRSSKGSVQIKASHDRLQLVFSYAGKRQYFKYTDARHPSQPQNCRNGSASRRLFGQLDATISVITIDSQIVNSLHKLRKDCFSCRA
jgi:hypothetical protein